MPDVNALNYVTLRNAVLGKRFPASTSPATVKRLVSTAYQDVWSAEDWTFKHVTRENLAVTSGNGAPTMPATFGDAEALYDQFGEELQRMSQPEFEAQFAPDLALSITGQPWAYMVANRQITLGPTPNVTTTFKLSYRRRLASRTSALVVQAGMMSDDADYPLWDDHHSVLIPRAQAIGLLELNDPTWQQQQDEYERQLDRMGDDYAVAKVPVSYGAGRGQWGSN